MATKKPARPLLTMNKLPHAKFPPGIKVCQHGWQESLAASFPLQGCTHTHTIQLINKNLIITGLFKANVTEF